MHGWCVEFIHMWAFIENVLHKEYDIGGMIVILYLMKLCYDTIEESGLRMMQILWPITRT